MSARIHYSTQACHTLRACVAFHRAQNRQEVPPQGVKRMPKTLQGLWWGTPQSKNRKKMKVYIKIRAMQIVLHSKNKNLKSTDTAITSKYVSAHTFFPSPQRRALEAWTLEYLGLQPTASSTPTSETGILKAARHPRNCKNYAAGRDCTQCNPPAATDLSSPQQPSCWLGSHCIHKHEWAKAPRNSSRLKALSADKQSLFFSALSLAPWAQWWLFIA